MVTEHALLPVRPGRESELEAASARARPLITASPGCRGITLSRGVESPGTYLLLVVWESVDDHEAGFRGSPASQGWKDLLHRFYDPFPVVEHVEEVDLDVPAALTATFGTVPDATSPDPTEWDRGPEHG